MGGKHEPPSRRSLYISVATTTLRAAIVIALVVGGIVLIDRAFPSSEGALGGAVSTTTPPATSTSPAPTGGQTGGEQPERPKLAGLNVAVRNGTGVTGLAADTAQKLEARFGVNAIQIDDAPTSVAVTTIYYRREVNKDEAQALADRFFKGLQVEVLPLEAGSGVDRDVQIAIYLGADYATAQG
jgi:hypothetical protein